MEPIERIYALDHILKNNRYPVSQQRIQGKMACTQSTFTRNKKIPQEKPNELTH